MCHITIVHGVFVAEVLKGTELLALLKYGCDRFVKVRTNLGAGCSIPLVKTLQT